MCFFSPFYRHQSFFFSFFSVMSNPSRSQQRFPFRTPVRVYRNNRKLSPIKQRIRPIEQEENEPTKSSLSVRNIEVKYDTPVLDPREFWVKLRKHIVNETSVHNDDHGNQRTPNKVVRIFVSSTFTDFFNEREVLIKKVMNKLRIMYKLFFTCLLTKGISCIT
jgi:hypothetical protein